MYFYYGIIVFLFIFYYSLKLRKKAEPDKIFLFVTFFILILIGGLRDISVGGDLNHYIPNFSYLGQQSFADLTHHHNKYGYIFSFLCKIEYWISNSPTSFLLSMIALALIPVYFFIKRYSPNYLMSSYIYITYAFYTNTFNSIRSSLALGIGLFTIKYVIERRFWKFILCYLIAVEIHFTFAPFIILYLIYTKKITLPYMLASIGVCFFISRGFASWDFISSIAASYDEGAYGNDKLTKSSGGYAMLALNLAITFTFYYINRLKKDDEIIKLCMHCMIIACCVLVFATNFTLLNRVAMFFYIISIIYFPITLSNIKRKQVRLVSTAVTYLLFFVYFVIFIMTPLKDFNYSNNQKTIPYETIIQH
jgi:hypothetical protein